jgi:integrase/recombinase XerD
MGKIVSSASRRAAPVSGHVTAPPSLYAPSGGTGSGRKYLNRDERRRVLVATENLERRSALFALTLAWTGARISEVLALTPTSFQIEESVIAIVTLKRRRWNVREVPIPPDLMRALALEFNLSAVQREQMVVAERIWPMSRTTAWRVIKHIMFDAGISGRGACPRGLRHAFGVGTLQAGVPITLLQRWLGHTRLSTTEIYANAIGAEELSFASQFWTWSK